MTYRTASEAIQRKHCPALPETAAAIQASIEEILRRELPDVGEMMKEWNPNYLLRYSTVWKQFVVEELVSERAVFKTVSRESTAHEAVQAAIGEIPAGYSAKVEMCFIRDDGERFGVAQTGPEFIIFREPHPMPPCEGTLIITVDGEPSETAISLPVGASDERYVPIAAIGGE